MALWRAVSGAYRQALCGTLSVWAADTDTVAAHTDTVAAHTDTVAADTDTVAADTDTVAAHRI